MREIKFRAWHTVLKKMFTAEEMGNDQLTLSVDGRGFVNISSESTERSVFAGNKMIPLQFTGLKDKNGKEIFEGDKVKVGNGPWWEVKMTPGLFWNASPADKDQIEVIGNIYES